MITAIALECREDIEQADRESLVAFLEDNGFQCYDYENEECLRIAALDHWDTENKTEFKFMELSDSAKEKALQKYALPDANWWDCTYENYKTDQDLIAQGFVIDKINFSGFCSQGDGACWQGKVYIPEYVTHFYTEPEEQVLREALRALVFNGDMWGEVVIKADGRYSHEYTMQSVEPDIYTATSDERISANYAGLFAGAQVDTLLELVEPHLTALSDHVLKEARNIARRIYKDLESEYDGYFEEESFSDHADCNDWKFDEDGDMI